MDINILEKSLIGKDFLRFKDRRQPSIDVFLDYRNSVNGKMIECKETDISRMLYFELYQIEIDAIDEILKYLKIN